MLENLKEVLVNIAKKAENSGLCQHKSGNFSIRDKETGYVLVTPSGISREELEPKQILVVDLEGNIIEQVDGVTPTSETPMHLTVYRNRPDVFGVVHTHSKYATSFAVQNKPIEPIVFEAIMYGGVVPVAPYGTPCGPELAETIVDLIKDHNAILLERHGVLSVADDIYTAYLNAHYIEDVAEISFISTVIGGGKLPNPISQAELDKVGKA